MSEPIFQIGATKETVEAARSAVAAIICSGKSDQVILAALKTYRHILSVGKTNVSNCTFYGGVVRDDKH